MTPAIRAKRARRSKGCCPYCRAVMTVGQMIVLLPGLGWAHATCVADKRRTQPKENTVKNPATSERAIRCRYKRRDENPCPNPAADQSPDAWIVLCAHHLARAVQLVNDQMKTADAAVLRRAL